MRRLDWQAKWLICSAVASLVFLAGAATVLGFGGRETGAGYPTVTVAPPAYGQPVTEPNGAVVQRPLKPTSYAAAPARSCEWVGYSSGSRRPVQTTLSPPAPGLRAVAATKRSAVLTFWFRTTPTDCRPVAVLVSILANDDLRATPLTRTVSLNGATRGTAVLTYPSFLAPPDVAMASSLTKNGRRSRVVKVLIKR
jgi:hypothetical protein